MKKGMLTLALVLCLVFCALPLSSCGNRTPASAGSETVTGQADASGGETTVATTDKWDVLAPQITMLAERVRTLRIEYSMGGSEEKRSRNDVYLKGPDSVIDGTTPKIQQMIYERNKAANELLGTTTEYVEWDYGFGLQEPQMDLVIRANAADAPDLFVNMLNDLNKEVAKAGFKDVWSIPNSFFDFKAGGWLTEWMESLSFTDDRAYILGSDYFLDVFRAMSLLPFNVTLMDENAAKLAPAILDEGETLGVGEELSTRFFDFVENGKWTWDVLGKFCEAAWVDLDGDGQDSIRDFLGIIADGYGGIHAASYVYSCGEELTEVYTVEDPSSEYNNKQWIKYADDSTGLNQIFDAVKAVFEGSGSLSTSFTFSGNEPDKPGAAYHHKKFAERELLFAGVCTLATLEDVTFQEMEDLFSVVPLPKIDSSKSYNTLIINQGDAGAINVNVNPVKAKALTAFIQYCTEHSGDIREQFLQTVMKYKITTYNQGTDRMLNIIYAGILWGRDYTVDGENRDPRWHRLMMSQKFVAGSEYISTQYTTYLPMKTKRLDEHMKTWYTLPTVEKKTD